MILRRDLLQSMVRAGMGEEQGITYEFPFRQGQAYVIVNNYVDQRVDHYRAEESDIERLTPQPA